MSVRDVGAPRAKLRGDVAVGASAPSVRIPIAPRVGLALLLDELPVARRAFEGTETRLSAPPRPAGVA